jgi:hypothetical protein
MSASVVSPVFVGRRAEMASLAALMKRAHDGAAAFALIGGEAGVGKTRLVEELAAQASGAGFTVLVGHCIELGAEGLPTSSPSCSARPAAGWPGCCPNSTGTRRRPRPLMTSRLASCLS